MNPDRSLAAGGSGLRADFIALGIVTSAARFSQGNRWRAQDSRQAGVQHVLAVAGKRSPTVDMRGDSPHFPGLNLVACPLSYCTGAHTITPPHSPPPVGSEHVRRCGMPGTEDTICGPVLNPHFEQMPSCCIGGGAPPNPLVPNPGLAAGIVGLAE